MAYDLESDIIKYWRDLGKEDKKKFLQQYENKISRQFEREEREVVIKEDDDKRLNGRFSRNEPDIISVYENDYLNDSGLNAINVVYHEGLHASLHDYIADKHVKIHHYDETMSPKKFLILKAYDRVYYKHTIKSNKNTFASNEEAFVYEEATKNTIKHMLKQPPEIVLADSNAYYNLIMAYVLQKKSNIDIFKKIDTFLKKEIGNIAQEDLPLFCLLAKTITSSDESCNSILPNGVFVKNDNSKLLKNHLDFMSKNIPEAIRKNENNEDASLLNISIAKRLESDMKAIKHR